MFTWILKNDWFKKKATFARSGKVEMISTFQRNHYFKKVLVNKIFTHVQEQKKAMPPRHSANIPSGVKSPLHLIWSFWSLIMLSLSLSLSLYIYYIYIYIYYIYIIYIYVYVYINIINIYIRICICGERETACSKCIDLSKGNGTQA